MRIGINALFQASGGSLTHLRLLLSEWQRSGSADGHEIVVFAPPSTAERLRDDLPSHAEVVPMPSADRGLLSRLRTEQLTLPRELRSRGIDVLYCPGSTVPLRASTPCVLSIQNAAPFCRRAGAGAGPKMRLRWNILSRLIRWGAKRADRVVFLSQHFKQQFQRIVSVPDAKCIVLPRGYDRQFVDPAPDFSLESSYGLRRPYILNVSHVYPYKNMIELVDGFAAARAKGLTANAQLVIAGRADVFPAYTARLRQRIAALRIESDVVLTGLVPPEHIPALLAGAEMFVFTSTCENCPTALVEALAAGKPTACSNVGVMPEVTGDAALPFDPDSPVAISQAIGHLMNDAKLRATYSKSAAERAVQFPSASRTARVVLTTLAQAAISKVEVGRLAPETAIRAMQVVR